MTNIPKFKKTTPWTVIASGRVAERVPRISGYQYYALPYVMDPDVAWDEVLSGIDPRAYLLSKHPAKLSDGTPNPKAEMVYPTDVTKAEDRENFLGILIDGHNFEQDQNVTVTLLGAVELRYIQTDASKPWGKIDADVVAHLADLGITRLKDGAYWDSTRRALK